MGGKTKQRIKNNARPSNSSRSAELLGSTGFVGFAAHAEFGMVPLVPGFTMLDSGTENFEGNLSSEFQLVLRKMLKKDPMTKKKALNEFIDLVNKSELHESKAILPLFPRYYHNLATDTEHVVRELSQNALRTLLSKCKRAVAPYLKQLVPIWLQSQFDSYAPAASIAVACFKETFAEKVDRTQEVLMHCHAEIIENCVRNLTFHTPATLSHGKSLPPEEAELKYQRAVIGSLKALSFLVEKTGDSVENTSKIANDLQSLIQQQKFLSLVKHKNSAVRAAWFEFIYQVMQSEFYKDVLESGKVQLINVSFQNIDEENAAVGSFAWGCVLLIQTNYKDWCSIVNLRKVVLPKLSTLFRNNFNGNATILCPNLLPFFSQITPEILEDIEYDSFCEKFFGDLKESILVDNPTSRAEVNAIIKAYFECVRYLLQKLNNTDGVDIQKAELIAIRLFNDNLLVALDSFIQRKSTSVKCFFQQMSSLIAFLSGRCYSDNEIEDASVNILFKKLLNDFWQRVSELINNVLKTHEECEKHFSHCVAFIHDLYVANPNFEGQKIKFTDSTNAAVQSSDSLPKVQAVPHFKESSKSLQPNQFIVLKLRKLVIDLVRKCLESVDTKNSLEQIRQIHRLTQLFSDNEFYKSLSNEETTSATLNIFQNLFETVQKNDEASELVVDIIFEILHHLETAESFAYIKDLLKNSKKNVKLLILQRLLSYPYCNEIEVRSIIAQPEISSMLIEIAHEALSDNTKEKFNILHKCFFQIESGEILIDCATVDGILEILCDSLFTAENKESIDACSSFLAQTMPVFCSGENASSDVKQKIFIKLFEFTMKHLESDEYISEETLWEITTCWQDALSSGDILIEREMACQYSKIIQNYADSTSLKYRLIESMADALSKFITCSTEHIMTKDERLNSIDSMLSMIFQSNVLTAEAIDQLLSFSRILEVTKGVGTAGGEAFENSSLQKFEIQGVFRRALLNLTTIKKLICKVTTSTPQHNEEDEEITEDYCDVNENLLTQWTDQLLFNSIKFINIGAAGETILNNNLYNLDNETEEYLVALTETVKSILSNDAEMIKILNEKLLEEALKNQTVESCRTLQFLVYNSEYSQFEENATILLDENLCESFVAQGAYKAYVCSLMYLLPNLSSRALTMQNSIMSCEPRESWVKAVMFRCLIKNNFENVAVNEAGDKSIGLAALQFITHIVESNQNIKEHLLYNTNVYTSEMDKITTTVEYINLLCEIIQRFPFEMSLKNWDALRLGLSSWTLSVSKSILHYSDPKVFCFIARVFQLYEKLKTFILSEKGRSSTTMVINVIEEWENLFAREVDLVLFNIFVKLCDEKDKAVDNECFGILMEHIVSAVEIINFDFVYSANKDSGKLDNICSFLLKNLSNNVHCIRTCCAHILHEMTKFFVASDILTLEKNNETLENPGEFSGLHFLNHFDDYLTRYGIPIFKYLQEFSFKLTEINEFSVVDRDEALSYLLLWDCILYTCANSPISLRSIYTTWLHENRYEERCLPFLFRCMPSEILKNHDSKVMNNDIFKSLTHAQIKDPSLSVERLACSVYTDALRKLPAIIRKWWNTSPSRQKTFVDKLTTNFVSPLICCEELKTIANRREKHENMQVTVHNSTREVLAVYSIDEARMELVITLAPNYPLGSVKVEVGKQIGGRGSSRNIGMQLSIFLTHQNGTICDGLSLWKSNLDKKFEGVEECYICYNVIHQETCQLPKLSCRTCKKKFHGPCLYKWFTMSSKSTCPICRNVF